MMRKGHSSESADKICGKLKAEHEKSDFDVNEIVSQYKQLETENPYLPKRTLLDLVFHSSQRSDDSVKLEDLPFVMGDFVLELCNDFESTLDFLTEDVRISSGLPTQEGEAVDEGMYDWLKESKTELEGLNVPSTKPFDPSKPFNVGMTPVESSYVKGAGVYKNHLLLQFHHDPRIWGYPLGSNIQANGFFQNLMQAGSKGAWVWDEILQRPKEGGWSWQNPSQGMASGQFYVFNDDGKPQFRTSQGAKFIHKVPRPAIFNYNPVGFGYGFDEQSYKSISEAWKEGKMEGYIQSIGKEPFIHRQKYEGLGTSKKAWKFPIRKDLEPDGRWITVKGTHVFVPKGQSMTQALTKFVEDKRSKGKSNERKLLYKEKNISSKEIADAKKYLKRLDRLKEGGKTKAQLVSTMKEYSGEKQPSEEKKQLIKSLKAKLDKLTKLNEKATPDERKELAKLIPLMSKKIKEVKAMDFIVFDTALDDCKAKGHTEEECFKFFNSAKEKSKPKYKQVKNIDKKYKEKINQLNRYYDKLSSDPTKYTQKIESIKAELDKLVKRSKEILPERSPNYYKKELDDINEYLRIWNRELNEIEAMKSNSNNEFYKDQLDKELIHAKEVIEKQSKRLEGVKKLLKKAETYEQEKYITPIQVKTLGLKLHDSVKIDRELYVKYRDKIDPKSLTRQIQLINDTFESLPNKLTEDVEQLRIYFDCNEDDPDRQYNPNHPRCGGYYSNVKAHGGWYNKITVNLGDAWTNKLNSEEWQKQILIHECAHSLDYSKLQSYEQQMISRIFTNNEARLKENKEYASKNKRELFAEAYTNAYFGNSQWFYRNFKDADRIRTFFTKIVKKYDFVGINDMKEKRILKFSYMDGNNHIYGKVSVPNEYPLNKAEALINEGKASWVSEHSKARKTGKADMDEDKEKIFKKQKKGKHDLTEDFIATDTYQVDFTEDYTRLWGPITHGPKSGHFEYKDKNDPDKIIKVVKDWNSIKKSHDGVEYYPVIGTTETGSHKADVIGFTHNFTPNEDTEEMYAETILFNDLIDISNIDPKAKRQVSIGFDDEIKDGVQYIKKIDHLAMSLDNKEMGRCAVSGKDCYQSIVEDFVEKPKCPYGIQSVLKNVRHVITITNNNEVT